MKGFGVFLHFLDIPEHPCLAPMGFGSPGLSDAQGPYTQTPVTPRAEPCALGHGVTTV